MKTTSLILNGIQEEKIRIFAYLIHEYNSKFNLTSLSSPEEIRQTLILESILPVRDLEISPGSHFIDIGTGSGIPGIPIGIYYDNITGYLIDSNKKKQRFIELALDTLNLTNLMSHWGRAEEMGREERFREKADWVLARAVGNVFLTMELGAPLVACGGHMYIYSTLTWNTLNEKVKGHANTLGMSPVLKYHSNRQSYPGGILLKKISNTDGKYPRRFSAILREAKKAETI